MSDNALEIRRRRLQDQVRSKQESLTSSRDVRDQYLRKKKDLHNDVKGYEKKVNMLVEEIQCLKESLQEQKEYSLKFIEEEKNKKVKEKQALDRQMKAQEDVLRPLREKEQQFQEKKEEEKQLSERLTHMRNALQGIGPGNYKLFVQRSGLGEYPGHGSFEERLNWVIAFGQFVDNLSKSM